MSFFNRIKKEDFYIDLTEKNQVLDGYEKLNLCHDNTIIFNNTMSFDTDQVVSRRLFPLYLNPTFNIQNNTNIVKVSQDKINGYAIRLKQNQSFETFFKEEFSKSFRANINRFVTRFECCFNANYKMFYGDISKEDYTFLMKALQNMLTNRFNQRNDENKILKNWEYYESSTYDLINNKKASLFVIYHNQIPVHICVNHHFNNILFVSIPSYDIDFAKFALGNISIYKLLEWSLNNNYLLLDMAYGDLEYKRRWSTLIYGFEHHIIYKNDWKHILIAKFEISVIHFKNYLKSKNIDDKIKSIKNKLFKSKNNFTEPVYVCSPIELSNNGYRRIHFQFENSENQFLKKPVFDFLYKNKEHIDHIDIFEIQASKEYIISGKNTSEKITFL